MKKHILIVFCTLLSVVCLANGSDTTVYYQAYNHQITGRFFVSNKYTNFRLRGDGYSLFYRPTTSYNLGVGFTHEWLTLNVGYGFGFVNPNVDKKGTRSIDLQFHPYGRKIAIDVLGQFYKGYQSSAPYDQLRTDIRVNAVGATIQYIFNYNKFSYRAAFLQSEWQKRSAGTWLAGFEVYAGAVRADSSLIPDQELLRQKLIESKFVEFGPSVGYAYTYVYREHYFVTGSASVSLDVGFNTTLAADKGKDKEAGFSPNTLLKFFGGYNSSKWAITAIYLYNTLNLVPNEQSQKISMSTGNFRIHFAYRFKPSKKTRRLLKPLDDIKKIDG